eukprot:scaffold59850_cov17-Tisochrysis_lutea.AAC.1
MEDRLAAVEVLEVQAAEGQLLRGQPWGQLRQGQPWVQRQGPPGKAARPLRPSGAPVREGAMDTSWQECREHRSCHERMFVSACVRASVCACVRVHENAEARCSLCAAAGQHPRAGMLGVQQLMFLSLIPRTRTHFDLLRVGVGTHVQLDGLPASEQLGKE